MPAPLIHFQEVRSLPISGLENFTISRDETWAFLGGNGSGKSTLASLFEKAAPSLRVKVVSFEGEQQLLEREIYDDDSEFFDTDHGRTTRELIDEHRAETVDIDYLIKQFQLEGSVDTGFKLLSTGERRRMMLARAVGQAPELLVLDEPFDGLDVDFTKHLHSCLEVLEIPVILIVNRLSHIFDKTTHIGYLQNQELLLSGPRAEVESSAEFMQLQAMTSTIRELPSALEHAEKFIPTDERPIADLRNIRVAYSNKAVISGLDWKILPGEHWKVSGPNGCGKSTLVNLISGDHPQCYSNEMYLFGFKRGVGESIWDVKRHMGLMSTTLHQQHRITVTAETVLLSGFFDTIGVYRPVSVAQRKVVADWLEFLKLSKHKHTNFHALSFGIQRMLLIARALIKRPYLLILDEPCQGLDPMNRALVINLVEEIVRRNIAQIIYISHEPEDVINCITHELRFIPDSQFETRYSIHKREF